MKVERKILKTRTVCHVCGDRLKQNIPASTETCVNPECQVYGVVFTIPFVEVD